MEEEQFDDDHHHWEIDHQDLLQSFAENESLRNSMAYSFAMATPKGSKFPTLPSETMSLQMQDQLRISEDQLMVDNTETTVPLPIDDSVPLPVTYAQALGNVQDPRAMVVTEATSPFRIVNVNSAWEDLCGYTANEAKGKMLGELLQGPATKVGLATNMNSQVMSRPEEATAVLVNYKKNGNPFYNRVHIGPLYPQEKVKQQQSKMMAATHFVGILQEVTNPMMQARVSF